MKATQEKPAFSPVVLTLETQEEVDAVYAIFNMTPIVNAVGLKHPWACIKPFSSGEYATLFTKLSSTLK